VSAAHLCVTCGTQYPPSPEPPEACPICLDERQYVRPGGQAWTTPAELAAGHRNRIEVVEPGLTGIGTEPKFAIGQRALLVDGLLWDCVSLLDDATAEAVEAAGGLRAIAISHPHYYSAMVEWAERFDCPVYLHADDRDWIMRPSNRVELWSGETKELGDGLTLVRCGGHFAGGQVLLSERDDALLTGDIVQVIPDREWVSFMYSYPNLIPLDEDSVRGIVAALEPFSFERIVGAWWGRIVSRDGKAVVARSAERYARALRGQFPR
jgi:hypothetical protein